MAPHDGADEAAHHLSERSTGSEVQAADGAALNRPTLTPPRLRPSRDAHHGLQSPPAKMRPLASPAPVGPDVPA
jgi:hypothetical protein